MTDRKTTDRIKRVAREAGGEAPDAESGPDNLQCDNDEWDSRMDSVLMETMDRSNRFFMESENEHLITKQVFNASNDGIWAINRNRKVIRANKKLLTLFDRKTEQVLGHQCVDLFPGACPLERECPWKKIDKGEPVVEQEITLAVSPEESRIFRVVFTPLANLEGDTIGLVETYSDITTIKQAEEALRRANRELERLAGEDGLTRIANRRSFDNCLELEWRRQKRAGKPISLIMCDVDFFKKYNDTYGHQAGDACLATVAAIIKNSVHRAGDLAARYGGEEFAVLMPETDIEGARRVVDRIRCLMQEKRMPHERSDAAPHVTLSFGIASMVPSGSLRPEALIESADRMLYRAKQKGRNCVVSDDGNPSQGAA